MMERVLAFGSSLKDGKVTVRTHTGDTVTSDDLGEVLEFLTRATDDPRHRVVWSVNTFAAPIASLLPSEALKALIGDRQRAKLGYYTLLYTSGRVFNILGGERWHAYSDVSQYYEEEDEPRSLKEVAAKIEDVLEALGEIGIHPKKISSHNHLFEPLMNSSHPNLPSVPRFPSRFDIEGDEDTRGGIINTTYQCTRRLWREAHQIGYWTKAYDYDVTSSFPSVAKDLYDPRAGEFIVTAGERPQGALYGWLEGMVTVTSDLAPIGFIDSEGSCLNPTGTWYTALPHQLYELLYDYGLGIMQVESALWWKPRPMKPQFKPMLKPVEKLYGDRNRSPLLNGLCKRALVSLFYGQFIQKYRNEQPGKYFFPPWASMIEGEITAMLARFILDNKAEENLIHATVDGCLLDKEVKVGSNGEMGEWRLDSAGPAIVAGTGVYFHGDKRICGLTFKEAKGLLEKNPYDTEWGKLVKCKVGIGDAMGKSVKSLGKVVKKPQGFSLKQEHDRKFERTPLDGKELLECEPYESKAYTMKQLVRNREECRLTREASK